MVPSKNITRSKLFASRVRHNSDFSTVKGKIAAYTFRGHFLMITPTPYERRGHGSYNFGNVNFSTLLLLLELFFYYISYSRSYVIKFRWNPPIFPETCETRENFGMILIQ